jgi:hypothetical protein
VARDIPAGARVLGTPARPEGEEKRIYFSLDRLPALCRDVRRIKQLLGMEQPRGSRGKDPSGEGEVHREAS